MSLLKYLALLMIGLLLTSCASMQPAPQIAQNENMGWDARVETLSKVKSWDLKAAMALRNLQKPDAWTATLQWQQQKQNYHIALFGPLGTNAYELTGRPGHVELAEPNGKHFVADSPETLLAEQAGWTLPVSNLYYWVRGLPVPNMPAEKTFDNFHHLTQLKQQGWTVNFLRYTSVNHIDVPSKIFLDNPNLNVKLVINQWQF